MSQQTDTHLSDLFNNPVHDDVQERERLVRMISYSEGFSLIFAVCNRSELRDQQIALLREQSPELRIQEVALRQPVPHLLYVLREMLESPPPDVVFVYGMENWIPGDKDPKSIEFIANLNAGRNHFVVDCPCPLVLWIPEYLHSMIQRGAPDFASVRSGYYSFASPPDEFTLSQTLFPNSYLETASTPNEREMRVVELTIMLQRLRSLPKHMQDKALEVRTLNRLINVLMIDHKLNSVRQYAIEALELARSLEIRSKEVFEVYYGLARIEAINEHFAETENWITRYFALFPSKDNTPALFAALMDSLLGTIYIRQRRYVEASVHLLDALHIFDNLKYVDPSIVSDLFMTLSQLNFDQAKYTESIQCLELAMERLSVLPDKGGGRRATVLSNLALNYEVSGRLEEAIMAYDESLHELKQLLGNEHPKVLQLEQYYLDLLRRMGQ